MLLLIRADVVPPYFLGCPVLGVLWFRVCRCLGVVVCVPGRVEEGCVLAVGLL